MHAFIRRIGLRFAINAAIQRGANSPVYEKGVTDGHKRAFRELAKTWLVNLENRYCACEYDEDRFFNEIISFRDFLSNTHGQFLKNGVITIGRTQKMVSLYLKFLWLNGDVSKKPIFPVLDRKIIQNAGVRNPPNWTSLNDENELRRVYAEIGAFAQNAGFGSGSEWEAVEWTDEKEA